MSYRETSSSICSFIDSGGPLKLLGGMPLLWACVEIYQLKGCRFFFRSSWSPFGVCLQYCRLFGAAAPSHTTVLFSHWPPGIQSISPSPSAPQFRRNTNQSLVWPLRKLGSQTPTLLLPPKNEASRAPGPDRRATPVSAGSLVPNHASSTNTPSQGRGTSHSDSPQKAGTSVEPSSLLFPLLPVMGKQPGLSFASRGRGGCR